MAARKAGRPRVYGHPRSGNHALADFIYRNWFSASGGLAIEASGANVGHPSRRGPGERSPYFYDGQRHEEKIVVPYGSILGHHRFPNRRIRPRAVYVIRDGRDVALSIWRWKKMLRKEDEGLSLVEMLEAERRWGIALGSRDDRACTLFEYWMRHVSAWVNARGQFVVRYESLLTRPELVARRIAQRFRLRAVKDPVLPGSVGWNAGERFVVSRWKEQMPGEAIDLFNATVPRGFVGRWD